MSCPAVRFSGEPGKLNAVHQRVEAQSLCVILIRDDQRRKLDWEAEMPAEWAPSKGADALPPVKVRPGEKAGLEVTLRGPVADPVLKVKRFFGWHTWRLESVKAGEVRKFTGGPVVSGVKAIRLESSAPDSANALVEIVKRYRQ